MAVIQRSDRKYPDPSQLTHFPLPLLQNVFSRLDTSGRKNLHEACQGTWAARRISDYSAPIFAGLAAKKKMSLSMLHKLQNHIGLYGEAPKTAMLINGYCQGIEDLDLSVYQAKESGEALQCIERGALQNMNTLNLSGIVGFSRGHIDRLYACFQKLEKLTFQISIDSEMLTALTLRLGARLKLLDVSYSPGVEDDNVKAIALCCSELRELNLSFCLNVTDEGLKMLYQRMPAHLAMLNLDGCCGLKQRRTLMEFAKHIPFLTPIRGVGEQTACLEVYGLEALLQRLNKSPASMNVVQLIFYSLPTPACRSNVVKHVVQVAKSHGRTIASEWARGAFLGEDGLRIPHAWRVEAVKAAMDAEYWFGLDLP